jgi:two-component system cell cycle response regulator
VIEDNPTNLQLVVYLLEAFGHQVNGAREGAEGLEMARQQPYDLILLDIHMPKMDGYEVAQRLRADPDCRGTPIVAVTALAMVGDREKLLTSGFNGYISKPIDPETFAAKVQEFLGLPQSDALAATSPNMQASLDNAPFAGAPKAVLLFVDNCPTNLQLARSILVPLGYEVLTAASVQEGFDLARKVKPDVIVSDVHMPHQDGHALALLIRQDSDLRLTPFIFLSSSVSSGRDHERALAEGATRFLCRPIDPKNLIEEIEAAVGQRASPGPHLQGIRF